MHQWVEVYVREQPWPAATSVDRGQPSLIQVHTKPLPRVQEASPSRAHSVARSYHHHLIMHLAHKCKMVPTEYRKIMARPSQAGCALNRCRRQGPSSQDEKKKKLWAPSNKSAVIPHPQPQYPNQLSQVQVKPTTHLCLQVNWHYQVALKVQRSTCHRADTPHNHWVPPKLHQIPYWRTGNKNTQDPCLPGQY